MRHVCFRFRLFSRPEARRASERILRLLLEALVQSNELYLLEHPETPWLFHAQIPYRAEPAGEEEWAGIARVREQGWGDCEDLVGWRVAELRVRAGVRAWPDFIWRTVQHPDGKLQDIYHIILRMPDGRFEDPSRVLGMGRVIR